MGGKKFALLAVVTLLAIVSTPRTTLAAAVKADYQFQNSRASSAGVAPPILDSGVGGTSYSAELIDGVSRTVLLFPAGSGVILAPTTPTMFNDRYSVVLWFRLTQVDGYRKLLDFRNGSGEMGLYVRDGRLVFYGDSSQLAAGSAAPIAANTYVQVVLTRDASKNVYGYVNGALQFAFVDSGDKAVINANNTLRFFRDDNTTQVEHSGGAVARIRIYDDALTQAEMPSIQESASASGGADLGVTASVSPNPVLPGQNLTYAITVTNSGPATAVNATFSAVVPAGSSFQSFSAAGGWTCPTIPAVGSSSGSINCTAVNANVGAPAAFSMTTLVPAGTTAGTTITNSLSVSSAAPDSNAANNTAQAVATVAGAATITPTATPTVTATAAATTAAAATATATPAKLPGRWLDKPPTAKIPVDYCPTSGNWPVLYWGGSDGATIQEAATVCRAATTFWVRRGMQWLGFRKNSSAPSDSWTLVRGEAYYVGLAVAPSP